MNQGGNFTPGRPLQPYFGYSTPARANDYPVGVNIATQGRAAWGKVSFDVIKALIDAYDVARMCINHKIDELKSMELMFQPADGVESDVDDAIDAARLVLAYPDRELPYDSWLSRWLENAFKYDAAPLYRRRDYNGDIIGLEVVDGRTIAPYIDEHGRRPRPPAPAYWQVIHGMVGTWFTTDDLIYTPFRPQEDSPYGLAPIESVVLTANTDIRFQWHFLQLFTDGSVPAGFIEVPPDVSEPAQVREWQDHWDAMVMGDQAKLHQLLAVPNGSKYTATKPAAFDKAFPQYLMKRTCAAFGVVGQDLNLTDDVNRSTGEVQVDIQFRVNTLPWVRYVEGTLTRYLQHDIGLPVKVSLDTGRDKEDRLAEAQAHKLYVEMGAESPDEVRVDILGKRVDKERPTPRFILSERLGAITLLAIEGVAGKTDPDTYGPAKDQLVLDQPYVPPIPVVPTPGTTDDKASQAAIDAYQVSSRRALEAQQDPRRETAEQREQRGAKQQAPGTGDAPLTPAPQGSQAQQQAADQQEQEPVAKAVLTGAEADELAAFREFVRCSKRRGYYRDFVFKSVSPAIGAELNRGGRLEVEGILKAKDGAKKPDAQPDATAQAVYDQLAENFPADKLDWVLRTRWTGPQPLPLDEVDWSNADSWQASHEKAKVYGLAHKMQRGKANKPAIAIARPGHETVMIADGHHHALAAKLAHRPLPAYTAHVAQAAGPWDELHSSQQINKSGADGSVVAAGVAVRAADTGRVLMLQRGTDDSDPASGMWEFPGGHLEPGERPEVAARREWEEETGCVLPEGTQTGAWSSGNGVYAGYVWTVPHEGAVRIDDPRDRVINPDDPGRDHIEAIAWWDPDQLADNPAVRQELTADMPRVRRALGGTVAKADGDPKAGARSDETWPGWQYDLAAAAYWGPRIGAALIAAVDVGQIARQWLSGQHDHGSRQDEERRAALTAVAIGWLASYRTAIAAALRPFVADLYTDGYAIGTAAARSLVTHAPVDTGGWEPGDIRAAERLILADGDGRGLRALFEAAQVSIGLMADSRTTAMARALADAVLEQRTTSELGDALRMVLADPARTARLALAELTRASGAAASAVYQRAGVATHQWVTAGDTKVCVICDGNAKQGAIPLGTPFESGDLWPPAHPGGCRCATVPG